jgi:hypothetical protein
MGSRSIMPAKNPDEKRQATLMLDFLEQLERINRQFPGARLLVDLARDAGLEIARKQGQRIKRLRVRLQRAESRRNEIQSRLADLLHDLSTSTALLPVVEGQPVREAEPLVEGFRKLRDESYPAAARLLRESLEQGSRRAIMRFLAEEILYRAGPIIAEHRLRHVHRVWDDGIEATFLTDLRSHLAGKVNSALARATGLKVTPAIGKHLDALIGDSLDTLAGLMTATPQARLVVPAVGSALDAQGHLVRKPAKGGEATVVHAVLFPGLQLLETPTRLVVPPLVLAAAGDETKGE